MHGKIGIHDCAPSGVTPDLCSRDKLTRVVLIESLAWKAGEPIDTTLANNPLPSNFGAPQISEPMIHLFFIPMGLSFLSYPLSDKHQHSREIVCTLSLHVAIESS